MVSTPEANALGIASPDEDAVLSHRVFLPAHQSEHRSVRPTDADGSGSCLDDHRELVVHLTAKHAVCRIIWTAEKTMKENAVMARYAPPRPYACPDVSSPSPAPVRI